MCISLGDVEQLINTHIINPHKNSQAAKKGTVRPSKSLGEKSCGGGQQMAAMMLILINFNNAQPLLNFISINIFAAICWLPPLISQLFSPKLLRPHLFSKLGCFCMDITSFVIASSKASLWLTLIIHFNFFPLLQESSKAA